MRKILALSALLGLLLFFNFGCFGEVGGGLPWSGELADLQTGSVTGTILEATAQEDPQAGPPVANAFVYLDTGQSTYSDENGVFIIDEVLAGTHLITLSAPGYRAVGGMIEIENNTATELMVVLSAQEYEEPAPEELTGNLRIMAFGFTDWENNWVGVKAIEVWEYNNYSHRWYRSWSEDYFIPEYTLTCYQAVVGRDYRVKITWFNEDSNTYDVNLSSEDQTEYFYH